MGKKKSPLSIRIIYLLTNIASVLYLFSLAVSITMMALILFDVFGDDMKLTTSFPVKIDFMNEGTIHLGNGEMNIHIVDAQGSIHFDKAPKQIVKVLIPVMILIIPIFGYLLWMFRKFIVNVKNNIIFDIANMIYLRRLGLGLVGLWFIFIVYNRVFYFTIVNRVTLDNAEISSEMPEYAGILLVGLFIWMIAHIFKVGVDLQQEKELTI